MDPNSMQSKRKKRVVNGNASNIKVFPWQAFLIINKVALRFINVICQILMNHSKNAFMQSFVYGIRVSKN